MKVVLPLVVLLGVAGCGREPESKADANRGATATAARSADDSVAAVSQSSGKPAITLRFVVDGKPHAGTAGRLRLDLAGEPGPVAVRLQGEGLTVDPQSATVTLPADGKPASQGFSVTPQVAGITEIVVRIQPPADGAQEIVYAVPLLVEGAAAK